MVTQETLVRFGKRLREARRLKGLSQREVAEAIHWAQGQYSDIERAYRRPGLARAAVPDDEFLAAVSTVLEIPLRDLHAALGRIPEGTPADLVVREHLSKYNIEGKLPPETVDELSREIEDYTQMRIERQVRRLQEAA